LIQKCLILLKNFSEYFFELNRKTKLDFGFYHNFAVMPLFALVGSRGKKQCPQYIFFIVLVLLILLTSDEIKVKFKKVFKTGA
jgi:hypothetical protein